MHVSSGWCAAAVFAAATMSGPMVSAASADSGRTEVPVEVRAPGGDEVRVSYVSLRAPMPPGVGAHPAACDRIGYVRVRSAHGPSDVGASDGVVIAMPGLFGGANSLEITGRNFVRTAAEQGRHVEFWSIDRRANCLEDHWGIERARAKNDPRLAFDYYYRGAEVDGRRFTGFLKPDQTRWLQDVGLEQTVRDWHEIVRQDIPAAMLGRKVICAGHSLGGPLVAAYAGWDFDGSPATTSDAGYQTCAGYVIFDSRMKLPYGFPWLNGPLARLGLSGDLAGGARPAPYVNTFVPLTPETLQIMPVAALAADLDPDGESGLIRDLPRSPGWGTSLRLFFSRTYGEFASGRSPLRDIRMTNEAALGTILDDNSSTIGILRLGLGLPHGGRLAEKEFPLPYASRPQVFGLLGGNRLMVPVQRNGPLYTWRDRTEIEDAAPVLDRRGQPYTTESSETTDMAEFAEVIHHGPGDLLEQYFPTRILTDVIASTLGDRSGTLRDIRYAPTGRKPTLYLDAGEGVAPFLGLPKSPFGIGPAPSRVVTLEGVNHIDVGTAAYDAPDGSPMPLRAELADFALEVLHDR